MTFNGHLQEFDGKHVQSFEADSQLADLESTAWRIGMSYDDEDENAIVEQLSRILADPAADRLQSLVIGPWFSEEPDVPADIIVDALIAASGQLASLTSICLGDIIYEECEVSWIEQTDLSALLAAYPRLERFHVRGSEGLGFSELNHDALRSLRIECGGLDKNVLSQISAAALPSLGSLDIYLGTSNYGWNGTIEDVRTFLQTDFPKLTHLGLMNSEIQDDVTQAILESPLMGQLKTLDLSKGVLTNPGGQALLQSDAVKQLERLRIVYHFLPDDVVEQLQDLPVATEIDRANATESDWGDGEIHRYVAVGE